jgi:hypothetical protein
MIALAATSSVLARTHHRAAKPIAVPVATTEAPAAVKPANIPEKHRDPADIELDQKIKGICRGC